MGKPKKTAAQDPVTRIINDSDRYFAEARKRARQQAKEEMRARRRLKFG